MSAVSTRSAHPSRAVLAAETRLFLREPASLFWVLVFPTLLLVVLGAIPSFREPDPDTGMRVIDLYVPISIMLAAIMAGVQALPAVVTTYRERGVLRRIATTPARPGQLLAAQYAIHSVAVVVAGVIVTLVGGLVYKVPLPEAPLAYLLVLALMIGASLAVGGVVASVAPTAKVATAVGTALFFVMMFTSGLWLPVPAMPDVMAEIVRMTPLGAAALGLEAAQQGNWPAWRDLAVVVVWTGGLGTIAVRYFRWDS